VAHALPADALAALAAEGLAWPGAAVVLLRGVVLLLRALAVRAQAPGVAAAHAALQRAVASAAGRAVGLGLTLAGAVAVEVHHHRQAVLEAHGFDGEGFLLLPWAPPHLGLDAEAHLEGRGVHLGVGATSTMLGYLL